MSRRALLRGGMISAGALAVAPRLKGRSFALEPAVAVDVGAPPIITRAQWGADETIGNHSREFAPLVKAIVHHTAVDETDPAAQVRAIQRAHVLDNGWFDIGYNFLVDREGRIYEGRWARDYVFGESHTGEDRQGSLVVGAHAESHNPGCVGIAILGDYARGSAPVTDESLAAVARVIAWKFGPRGIDPHGSDAYASQRFANICGHRDVVSTDCPGDALESRLPQLRDMVSAELEHGLVGYRVLGADGSLWTWGAVGSFSRTDDIGDVRRNVRPGVPVRTAAGTPSGRGAWVADVNGSVYSFGDAPFAGSLGGIRLNRPIVGMAPTPSGQGYWLVASDGGIFTFGDARFFGSTGSVRLVQPIVDMAAAPDGNGYWLLAADGGLFTFGSAAFAGSAVGRSGFTAPATSMAVTPSGTGYWILDATGAVHGFGDAPVFGGGITPGSRPALAIVAIVRP